MKSIILHTKLLWVKRMISSMQKGDSFSHHRIKTQKGDGRDQRKRNETADLKLIKSFNGRASSPV